MDTMKANFLLIWFCVITTMAHSQVFKGRILTSNGDPIPYASLYIHEISSGLATDDNGCFSLTLAPGKYTCDISSLGYVGRLVTIEMGSRNLEKEIVLKERIYELREVNITQNNEDPAYSVMRQAIAYAPYYRTYVKSYTAGTYLKGTGKVHSIPAVMKISKSVRDDAKKYVGRLFVLEEQRKVTYTAPNKWDNEIKAYSNSFPDEINVSIETSNINLYYPTLFGKISPLNPRAFDYYRFRLDGCYAEGEYLVNKICVIPRKKSPELISGYIYIIDRLWCLSAVDLTLRNSGFELSINVTCKEVKPSVFLNTSASLKADIRVMGIKAEASYLSAIHYTGVEINKTAVAAPDGVKQEYAEADSPVPTKQQQKIRAQIAELTQKENLSSRDAYRLSKLVDKSLAEMDTTKTGKKYERKVRTYAAKKDSLAERRDSVYWAAVRSVPLKPEEVQSYVYKEKLKTSQQNAQGDSTGSTAKDQQVMDLLMNGKRIKSRNDKYWLNFAPLLSSVAEYNFVDGFWAGLKFVAGVRLSEKTRLTLTPEVYYTTARHNWIGSGTLALDYAPANLGKLAVSGGVLSADFNGESGENHLINAIASLWFAQNDVKLYNKRFLSVNNDIEITNGVLLTTGATWQKRSALTNFRHRNLFGKHAKPNLPRHPDYTFMPRSELLKVTAIVQYTPPRYYRMHQGVKVYDPSDLPSLTFKYERAFTHGGSGTISPSFHLTEFSAQQAFGFGLFNRIAWYANGGAFWNARQMQFPDYKHFATTRIPVTAHSFDQGLALPDNYCYSTNVRWAQANLSWYTPYLLFKQLPFLANKRFDEALHLRALAVYKRTPYWEAGYSIGYLDLARAGVFVGFAEMKYQSIGINIFLPLRNLGWK